MTDSGHATTLGGALRSGREQQGLSEDHAAAALEVPLATLRTWEADEARPTLDRLAKAAFVYRLDFAELLTVDRVPA